jgi:hypothetical protein
LVAVTVLKPRKRLAACFYFLFAGAIAFHSYRNSMFDIDLLAFAGNVALSDTSDPVAAHALVYKEPLTPHLRGTDGDDAQARVLRKRASDAYYSALYLPYFSVKPLYILAMEAVHKAGASVIDASRIVSALCFFGLAAAVWGLTRSPLAVVILILPETMVLGQANEPDGMSVMLVLLGLWALFLEDVNLGILPLIAAVWVRPDNAILCVIVLAFLWILGRVEWPKAAVLVALTVASDIVISHFGYGWRSLYSHTFLGGDPGEAPHFTGADYLHALTRGVTGALHSSAPVYTILWAVCLTQVRDRNLRRILGLVGLSSLLHFAIFPNYEPRYYGSFFIVTAAAAVYLLSDRSYWRAESR